MSSFILNFILYGVLGALLAIAGVSVRTQPLYFCLIMSVVVIIDLVSKFNSGKFD